MHNVWKLSEKSHTFEDLKIFLLFNFDDHFICFHGFFDLLDFAMYFSILMIFLFFFTDFLNFLFFFVNFYAFRIFFFFSFVEFFTFYLDFGLISTIFSFFS